MSRRAVPTSLGLCLCILLTSVGIGRAQIGSAKVKGAPPPRQVVHYGIAPDTGQYLPDSAILASVNDRTIRVGDFIAAYFATIGEYRPRPDSAGRAQFLNTMVKKEVLAHVARSVRRTDTFEDRAVMREHTNLVLANVLMQRTVLDSVELDEKDIRKVYDQLGYELHLKTILFGRREVAEQVRKDLLSGRMSWKEAVAKHSRLSIKDKPDGDLGWIRRAKVEAGIATAVFDLESGQISPVLLESAGYSLYQVVEKRTITPASFDAMRRLIVEELRRLQINERGERTLSVLRERMGMTYEPENIAWAASKFPQVFKAGTEGTAVSFELDLTLPQFEPADTSRVLARYRGGQISVGRFMDYYLSQSPLSRPSINTAEALRSQVDLAVLQPLLVDLARERGLERDSMAVAMIDKRREELLVEHLYQDSIVARVRVTPKERRQYYDKHTADFMTYATVRYATFEASSKSEADSLAARLKGGEKAEAILLADSRAGRTRGRVRELSSQEQGTPFYKLLFEELRPGQVSVQEPDAHGHILVVQSLSLDPGRLLSYAEAQAFADESVQNLAAEKVLNQFIERHKRDMKVVSHPELVMRVKLIDPTL